MCELSERALRDKIYFPTEISLIGEVYYKMLSLRTSHTYKRGFKLRQRHLHSLKAMVHTAYTGVSQPWQL